MTRKAVIYCRVSSKSQETGGHGLTSQETRCREWAAQKGLEVLAVFPDTMTGGGSFLKRPGMVALLSFLDAQPDEDITVIFDDLKRASRDTRAFLDLRDAFRVRGVRVECLNFSFDDTPEGEFIETIIAAHGALERKQNGRQVAQKMKARMQAGYWVHMAPVGYRYTSIPGRGKLLVPDQPLASIIVEAFEGYASGRFGSQAEVRGFFLSFPDFPRNKRRDITQQRVTDILSHPIYTGYICSESYEVSWQKGQHAPLISLELFDKVQARRRGAAKAPKRANIGDIFALRGMVECAECHVPLRSSITRGNGGHYPYYLCQTKSCSAYGKSTPRDKLEDEVGALVKQLQPTKGLIAMATAMFRRAWTGRQDQAAEIRRAAHRQIAGIEKQIDGWLDRIGSTTSETMARRYEDRIADLEREKLVLEENLAKASDPKGSFDEKLEPALTFLANPWKLWATNEVTLRRTVLKLAFASRLQYCRKEGARTTEISFPFKALGRALDPGGCFGAVEKTRFLKTLRRFSVNHCFFTTLDNQRTSKVTQIVAHSVTQNWNQSYSTSKPRKHRIGLRRRPWNFVE
ncbi:MAG: recombinase family protein [Pseudomonadota bacterium]